MAAQRAFSKLNLDVAWICGDARYLPFRPDLFECVFSYSVIQHFSEVDAELAIGEISRVLRRGAFSKIQMAHKGGLRSTYSRTRKHYGLSGDFRVRYWSLSALRDTFKRRVGYTTVIPEAFGGLGLLAEDRRHVTWRAWLLIVLSSCLKRFAKLVPQLIHLADSVYVVSTKA
jgi:SAM-dependent methyltransferase